MNIHISRRTMGLLLCLLFCIALLYRVTYFRQTVIQNPIRADAREYVCYAYNIVTKGVYSKEICDQPTPDSWRSPGYPLFLAIGMKMAGTGTRSYSLILFLQAFMGAVICLLTYEVGKFFLPRWGAYLAAFLVAICPHQVSLGSYILTETLFSFIFLGAILLFFLMWKKNRLLYAVMAGIAWGCAYLTNETVLFLPYIFALFHWFFQKTKKANTKKNAKVISCFLVLFTLFPAYWNLRTNLIVPASALKGNERALATLTHGTYIDFIYKTPKYKYFPYREDPMQREFSTSLHNFFEIFLQRFKERPVRYLTWYIFQKPYYLWSWNILQGQGDVFVYPVRISLFDRSPTAAFLKSVMKWIHPLILGISFIGCILVILQTFRTQNNGREALYVSLTLVYYTLLYTVFASWPRYSIPFRPELYLFAVWSLIQIINWKQMASHKIQ